MAAIGTLKATKNVIQSTHLITTQCRILTHLFYIAVENFVTKGEIACNKQFLLFSQYFLPYMALIFHFKCIFKMSSAICFNLDQSKILSSGNGLNDRSVSKGNNCSNGSISFSRLSTIL